MLDLDKQGQSENGRNRSLFFQPGSSSSDPASEWASRHDDTRFQ